MVVPLPVVVSASTSWPWLFTVAVSSVGFQVLSCVSTSCTVLRPAMYIATVSPLRSVTWKSGCPSTVVSPLTVAEASELSSVVPVTPVKPLASMVCAPVPEPPRLAAMKPASVLAVPSWLSVVSVRVMLPVPVKASVL